MVGYALQKLIKKYPGKVEYLSIGADFRKLVGLPTARHILWQSDMAAYYTMFSQFDICIAPILPTPFNDAKSEIKSLEAGRGGIPIVATNFGPYRRYVDHGEDGMLCLNEEDWFTHLRALVFDHDMRAEVGARGRAKAEQRTYGLAAPTWAGLYAKLLQGHQAVAVPA